MLSGKDTAVRRFFSGRRKARERAFYTGENLGSNAQLEMISFEKGNEYLCRCGTDDSMGAWVGWVGTCPADLWKPIRISHCFGVSVGIGSPNGGYGPPEIILILGIVEGDHPIRETQVQQSEQAGVLRRRQVLGYRRRLRDLVPVVLNGPIPELSSQCLVGRGDRAVGDSYGFDFVEIDAVLIARQRRRRARTKLV